MEEKLIDIKTAELAKNCGFDVPTWDYIAKNLTSGVDSYFCECSRYNHNCKSDSDDHYCFMSAPTQSLLQKWLREKHGFHIEILLSEDSPFDTFYYRVMKIGQYFTLSHDGFVGSYEEALEEGLIQALRKIE